MSSSRLFPRAFGHTGVDCIRPTTYYSSYCRRASSGQTSRVQRRKHANSVWTRGIDPLNGRRDKIVCESNAYPTLHARTLLFLILSPIFVYKRFQYLISRYQQQLAKLYSCIQGGHEHCLACRSAKSIINNQRKETPAS